VVEPLTRTISEQQAQLIAQAETIGQLRAELAAARAPESPVAAPTAAPAPYPPAGHPSRRRLPGGDVG
jgi:hypothetical protein